MSKFSIDNLIAYEPNIEDADKIYDIIENVNVENETDAAKLKKAFKLAKFAFISQSEEFDLLEKNLEDEIQSLRKQLKESGGGAKSISNRDDNNFREIEIENTRLEDKISILRNDIQELESKLYNEQTEKDKLVNKLEDVEKSLNKYKRENARLEDDVKEYTKKNQALLDKIYPKSEDDNAVFRDKIKQKNKLIEDLEDENMKLQEDNKKLDDLLQSNKRDLEDAMFQMIKTTEDIKKFKLLQEQSDIQIDQYRKEIEILKSQIQIIKEQNIVQPNQESKIISLVDAQIKEYNQALQIKDEEIRNLQELVITLRDNLNRIKLDSDKTSVASLTKAVQDKDKQIEILKQQIEEFTREMDKSSAIINNLNKNVIQSSRMMPGVGGTGYLSKEAEQKIKFLENLLKESESRVKDAEEHASDKEKALAEALNRLDEYESGDYQLQQAIAEIKNYKSQIKIRDRDIETLTKHVNKIDYVLNDVLEENDGLRARLGMEPREKINVEELKDLKAVRAQEGRAVVHVLQKEIESLEEERIKLKEKIRKLAKLAGSKVNVAAYIEDDTDEINKPKDLIATKLKELDAKITQITNKSQTSRQPNVEIEDLRRKNEQLLQLQREYQNENQQLEQALKEIHNSLKSSKTTGSKGDVLIKCPSLEKLLEYMESNRVSRATIRNLALYNYSDVGGDGNHLVLKSEIDYLQGRNEELRLQLVEAKNELTKNQISLNKAQEELNKENPRLNRSGLVDTFHMIKLPPGMSPSSNDVISALNEFLIDTLQELTEYKRICSIAEKDLEKLKSKYSVQRHQLSLLYKDYIEENNLWKNEKSNFTNEIKKLNDSIDVNSVKLQEYDRLLKTLEKDEVDVRRQLAENSRQIYVHRTNQKQLERKCIALEDLELKLTKENKKLRTEIIQIEVAVQQRIGYLQRYKEMANFKILSFQKQLEECVPIQKLEDVNKQYNEVVQNYRQLLEKQDVFESKNEEFLHTEQQNRKFSSEIDFLRKELENEKEKNHLLEETIEKLKTYSTAITPRSARDTKLTESSNISMSKRLAAIEMKEINERQRADYAQRMYDEQRNLLRSVENRNLELENNFAKLSKKYLALEKEEQNLREELSNCIPKSVNDADKQRIRDLEKSESSLRIEVARLKELTEITLYQTEALEFIQNLNKKELECINSIDLLSHDDDKSEIGKLHRQIISLQISEATAIRKLQNSLQLNKKLETQLLRTEQKLDQERQDTFYTKKEFTSKITYLRATIQDLRHKYAGSIPLRQQEKFQQSKQALLETKKELSLKLKQVDEEKIELEDKIAEYQSRMEGLDILKNIHNTDAYKANEKLLEWHKKMENLRMSNLKLERASKRYKDEKKFLEEINRKYEITIVSLEEEIVRLEKDYDQKSLLWEHREADLERMIDHLKQQHQYIENLALNFGEISGKMPDPSLPIPNQLEQATNIIREHIKLLAEAKVQADLAKKRFTDLEDKLRKIENDVTIRDKIIADLRLRLPATANRDIMIDSIMSGEQKTESTTPVKAAQSTIESLQNRLNQKEQTIFKYQELLKLAREEISKLNKQHELEINNLVDKLNNTRDSNLKKIKENLKFTPLSDRTATKNELMRLQELEEVNVEQDNTISALNDKIRKLNGDIEQLQLRYEALIDKFNKERAMIQNEQEQSINRLNSQIDDYKVKLIEQEQEMQIIIAELENQKQINSKAPSNTMKLLVEKLKHQLNEKEEQHKNLTKALTDLRGDMVNIAKNNLLNAVEEQNQVQQMVEKTKETLQDQIDKLEEENGKLRKELKMKAKINDDLTLENEHLGSKLKTKDQKMKKILDENHKLMDDTTKKNYQSTTGDIKSNDNEYLRRQIRILEDKLKRQRPAEKPYEFNTNNALTQKFKDRIKDLEAEVSSLKDDLKDTKKHASLLEINSSKTPTDTQVLFKPDQQLHQKYHYILNENSILKREKHDLEVEVLALKRDNELKSSQLVNENQILKNELEKLKQVKNQNFSISKLSSNENLLSKVTKLNEENIELKKQLDNLKSDSPKNKSKMEEMSKYIELLKSEIEQLKNDNPESVSSTSSGNLRRIGESGKSTRELEKTIAMMKKMIVKLKQENEALKSNSLN